MSVVYPEPTSVERRAWYFKKQADRRRAALRFEVGRIDSFIRLREMLEGAEPWQADIINARIENRRAHRNAHRLKRAARQRAAAEAEQDRRVARA
ncbi:hypothetical protein [Microbacterium sp. UBA3486]|uniref:hypothetical protein n=1 Tax=Microbacterium TaxID=33882 RepID=UPI0025D31196|nr:MULTISPECIES: hypothetical protein [Microbacterium]